ncbi:hypothetical protein N7522_006259 [Penicillium canescens]|nr:hypothetical protein N7522_006259 [Penicillium canescens]
MASLKEPLRYRNRTSKPQGCQRIKATGAITKAYISVQKTAQPIKGKRWETCKFDPSDHLSFDREFSVLYQVSQLRSLTIHTPKIVQADSRSRVLVLSYPRLHWATLQQRVEDSALDLDTLLKIKQELRSNIELLYKHGIAYRFKKDCVFPVRKASGGWALYLGGWRDASFFPFPETAELQKKLTEQLVKMDQHFKLLWTSVSATSNVTGTPDG